MISTLTYPAYFCYLEVNPTSHYNEQNTRIEIQENGQGYSWSTIHCIGLINPFCKSISIPSNIFPWVTSLHHLSYMLCVPKFNLLKYVHACKDKLAKALQSSIIPWRWHSLSFSGASKGSHRSISSERLSQIVKLFNSFWPHQSSNHFLSAAHIPKTRTLIFTLFKSKFQNRPKTKGPNFKDQSVQT